LNTAGLMRCVHGKWDMGYLGIMIFTCEGKALPKFIYSKINLNNEIILILLLRSPC